MDQFGYLPTSTKIAVLRNPQTGFDSDESYQPGSTLQVINSNDATVVLTGSPQTWNNGNTDTSSGDKAWWFDFSALQTTGSYFIRDLENNIDSAVFDISETVYEDVLRQAFRTFFYQRAGHPKLQPYAEAAWEDGASHLGPLQDSEARLYNTPDSAASERDLSGGWYDAGDYNKYTNWTANYVIALLHTYQEKPGIWGDDFNIPESGNGIPDILDEIKWGMDSLVRMQNEDGSVLSIVGLDHASPPSSATGQSLYGAASTSATLTTAAAFALGAKIYASLGDEDLNTYADDLQSRAALAWAWADANPSITFRNNDSNVGTSGLGAGQQEVDAAGRVLKKLAAATYLFELTGETTYRDYFDENYDESLLISSWYISAFQPDVIHMLLYYTNLENATAEVRDTIQSRYESAMNGNNVWVQVNNSGDPYRAYIQDYTWGSSSVKAAKGFIFYMQNMYSLGSQSSTEVESAAQAYLHYLHGTNPLGKVYLSNMAAYGAENSVDQFYHTWFAHGSATWDSVASSVYGPAPGFVVGGPNPFYNWDSCCPSSCGGASNNARCGSAPLSPPSGQPNQKAYIDFNDSWPLNSWEITENSNGYQVNYLRLLSKFVN